MGNSGTTVLAQGTISADGTEQDILDSSSVGRISGWLSLSNMQAGDTLVVKLYEYIEGNKTLYDSGTYSGAQSSPAIYFPQKVSASRMVISIEQTAGTNRDYDYEFDLEISMAQSDILSDATPFAGADVADIKTNTEEIITNTENLPGAKFNL